MIYDDSMNGRWMLHLVECSGLADDRCFYRADPERQHAAPHHSQVNQIEIADRKDVI